MKMIKLFKKEDTKVELTEEQKKALEEKKAKRKKVAVNGIKIVGGIMFFIIGGALVLAAKQVADESTMTDSLLEPEEPTMLPQPEDEPVVIDEEPEPIEVNSEEA